MLTSTSKAVPAEILPVATKGGFPTAPWKRRMALSTLAGSIAPCLLMSSVEDAGIAMSYSGRGIS